MRIFFKVSVKFLKFPFYSLAFNVAFFSKRIFLNAFVQQRWKNAPEKLFFFKESEQLFLISKNFFERRRLLARLEALLIIAACGDVVERAKSIHVQLSLIWSAGHPLHQAVSHFIVIFYNKEDTIIRS